MTNLTEKTAEQAQDHYARWRKRLEIAQQHATVAARRDALKAAGVATSPQPDMSDCGFYRLPLAEQAISKVTGQPNGRKNVIGWEPIAYYLESGSLRGRISDRDMTANQVIDYWTWCCTYPISEEEYRRVAEDGLDWTDAPAKIGDIPAADRDVTAADNTPAIEVLSPDKMHAEAIDAAIGAAIKTVTSVTEDAQASGSKNRIAELRLAADKAGKAIYEPIYRQYTAEQKKWSPIIARATAEEKRLNTEILKFRESERQRIAKIQADALEEARKIDEANQRAADRAIARGEPEESPEVVEVAPVQVAAPIAPTYGTRKVKEEVKFFLDQVTSWDMLFAHYKSNTDVQALLMRLAGSDIKAGRVVPGTTSREGLI
jgi:hypothetical protein